MRVDLDNVFLRLQQEVCAERLTQHIDSVSHIGTRLALIPPVAPNQIGQLEARRAPHQQIVEQSLRLFERQRHPDPIQQNLGSSQQEGSNLLHTITS